MGTSDQCLLESPRGYLVFDGEQPTYANRRMQAWSGGEEPTHCAVWLAGAIGVSVSTLSQPLPSRYEVCPNATTRLILQSWRTEHGRCLELSDASPTSVVSSSLWQPVVDCVSHELGNRLSSLGNAKLLLARGRLSPECLIDSLFQDIDGAAQLLRDFCAVMGTDQRLSTRQVLDQLLRLQAPLLLRHQAQVSVTLSEQTTLSVPRGALSQLLLAMVGYCMHDRAQCTMSDFWSRSSAGRETEQPQGLYHLNLRVVAPRLSLTEDAVRSCLTPWVELVSGDLVVSVEAAVESQRGDGGSALSESTLRIDVAFPCEQED